MRVRHPAAKGAAGPVARFRRLDPPPAGWRPYRLDPRSCQPIVIDIPMAHKDMDRPDLDRRRAIPGSVDRPARSLDRPKHIGAILHQLGEPAQVRGRIGQGKMSDLVEQGVLIGNAPAENAGE